MQACFYTTVINTSGVARVFGHVGDHGKRLDINEQYTIPGNIIDRVAKNRRKFQALERSTGVNGSLAIISTPAVHLWDPTTTKTQILKLTNSVLGIADPCWGSYNP